MKKSGGCIVVDALKANGIEHVFGVPGESFLPILDALYDEPSIRLTMARQEGGAAMMADAYGKLTGKPGICLVTRGPGIANASAGIHVAAQDSTPMIVLMGQISSQDVDREAFQEVDVKAMFGHEVKWAAQVNSASRLSEYMARAFSIAQSGRSGPVVLALPEDVLRDCVEGDDLRAANIVQNTPSKHQIEQFIEQLQQAKRPLMIVGGEGWNSEAIDNLADFASTWNLTVGCAFRCQDRFENTHPNYAGDVGLGINPKLAKRIERSDFIIALGTRLGDCTSSSYSLFDIPYPKQKLVHIHAGIEELGRVYQADLAINSNVGEFLGALKNVPPQSDVVWADWTRQANADYEQWNGTPTKVPADFNLGQAMVWLRENLPHDAIITNGAGNYASWLHRFYRYSHYRTQLAPTSGSMGYGLPAAIAAKLQNNSCVVVALAGDGCFQMTLQELATVAQNNLKIIILVVNNSSYGTIRMHQENHYPGRVSGTSMVNPDFVALANAYGLNGCRIDKTQEFGDAMTAALSADKASLIEIVTDGHILSPTKFL